MSELATMTYEVSGRIARITLDRPQRGNGITRALVTELERCVERADLDPAVHVILLAGNGKGFCGGYDLQLSAEGSMQGQPSVGPPGSFELWKEHHRCSSSSSPCRRPCGLSSLIASLVTRAAQA